MEEEVESKVKSPDTKQGKGLEGRTSLMEREKKIREMRWSLYWVSISLEDSREETTNTLPPPAISRVWEAGGKKV